MQMEMMREDKESILHKQNSGAFRYLSNPPSCTVCGVILLTKRRSEGGMERGNEGWKDGKFKGGVRKQQSVNCWAHS